MQARTPSLHLPLQQWLLLLLQRLLLLQPLLLPMQLVLALALLPLLVVQERRLL